MNEEMIRQMSRMYNIPEEEIKRMIIEGSPELSGIEAGYNEQQGVPEPGQPGRMSMEDIANYNVSKAMANPSSRPGPLDYSVNLMPGNLPQPTSSISNTTLPSGAGLSLEEVNTPNPVQGLPGNMGRNPCAMMPGTVWNGKACVPPTLYNMNLNI